MARVGELRRATAARRRQLVVQSFMRELNPRPTGGAENALTRFRAQVRGQERVIVGNVDIDGLVSAAMLGAYTGWKVGVVVDHSRRLLVHPDLDWSALLTDAEARLYGVDVFSPLFPSVSNHPVLFGSTGKERRIVRQRYVDHDDFITDRVETLGSICPSAWVGIGASLGPDSPLGLPYKYPLGSAQVLLAVLELAGLEPRLFDRQYLPWVIANADGGATSIRQYAWNVELWWSALAAAAGPASNSEAIYRMVTNQRPNEFLDADMRLRWDEPDRSTALKASWNLVSSEDGVVADAMGLVLAWSGWPDPFLGGVEGIGSWTEYEPSRSVLPLKGITGRSEESLDAHLAAARRALHLNFSTFRERGAGLGWMLGEQDPALGPDLLGVVPEEDDGDDDPEVAEVASSLPLAELDVGAPGHDD